MIQIMEKIKRTVHNNVVVSVEHSWEEKKLIGKCKVSHGKKELIIKLKINEA
jgi:hypothetical protein